MQDNGEEQYVDQKDRYTVDRCGRRRSGFEEYLEYNAMLSRQGAQTKSSTCGRTKRGAWLRLVLGIVAGRR
jgi:hypothetical protein